MLLCLHHNDADGLCAGAIVRRRFGNDVELIETNYGQPVPWKKVDAAQTVIVTDFSLPKADMLRIYRAKGQNFIWIDHHISAIKEMSDHAGIAGLRHVDEAACVLTWQYFFPDEPVPPAVTYIGDRDIWRFAYPQTRAFSEGLFFADTRAGNDALWLALFNNDEAMVQSLMERGQILLEARLIGIARRVDAYSFETTFNGFRTLAINLPSSGDVGHHICSLGYDVAYVYSESELDGVVTTYVTLYSETADVSVLAKKYGGGGHKGAAGFHFVRQGSSPFPPE